MRKDDQDVHFNYPGPRSAWFGNQIGYSVVTVNIVVYDVSSVNMSNSTKGRKYHHGSLEAAVIETARAHIEARGVESLSLREIAREIGVSPNAPYRHFPSKEDLLFAILQHGMNELYDRLLVARHRGGLDEIGEEYVRFALDHPGLFRVMFSGRYGSESAANEEYCMQPGDPFLVLMDAVAERAGIELTEENLLQHPDLKDMGIACWTLVHGVAMLQLEREMWDRVIEMPPVRRLFDMIASLANRRS